MSGGNLVTVTADPRAEAGHLSKFERKFREASEAVLRQFCARTDQKEKRTMTFRVQGLEAGEISHLFGLTDAELERIGARRYAVDAKPGFPDRIEVRDLEVGETAILLNYEHQPAATPYRSAHAIFVREGADRALDLVDVIPEAIRIRPMSLRAFTASGDMLHADLAAGSELEPLIEQFLADPEVTYLHAHYAKRGCYAARIIRFDEAHSAVPEQFGRTSL